MLATLILEIVSGIHVGNPIVLEIVSGIRVGNPNFRNIFMQL